MANLKKELILTVTNDTASLSSPLYVYQMDKGIDIMLQIKDHNYLTQLGQTMLKELVGGFAKVTVLKPDQTAFLVDNVPMENEKIKFTITAEMTDDLAEVGTYALQISLMNQEGTSCVTIPPVSFEVKKRIAIVEKPVIIPSESVLISETEKKVVQGDSLQLFSRVLPNETTDRTRTWASSDSDVATVDEHGVVSFVVQEESEVGSRTSIEKKITIIELKSGTDRFLEVIPQGGEHYWYLDGDLIMNTISTFTYHSQTTKQLLLDSPNIKTFTGGLERISRILSIEGDVPIYSNINKTGFYYEPPKVEPPVDPEIPEEEIPLEVTITATNGTHSSACEFTVYKDRIPTEGETGTEPVTEILINKTDGGVIGKDKTDQLFTMVLPHNALSKKIEWTSSDESVATVDSNGVVSPVPKTAMKSLPYADHSHLSAGKNHFVYVSGDSIMLFVTNYDMNKKIYVAGGTIHSGGVVGNRYEYTGQWVHFSTGSLSNHGFSGTIYESTHDIYADGHYTTVLFYAAPPKPVTITATSVVDKTKTVSCNYLVKQ